MTIYGFYIFDRHCECIYRQKWNQIDVFSDSSSAVSNDSSKEKSRSTNNDEEKLVFGVVFSLRNMVKKVAGNSEEFLSYSTSKYKLHFYETPSNIRMALLTSPNVENLVYVLHQVYATLYVEFVAKYPLYSGKSKDFSVRIQNRLFDATLDRFVRTLR
ncbi:TRAPP complex subunit Bet5 [Schizosaccharomyces japonicus yFS275]|uniref:Trafficking protein particle complex subunit n=1 Tax=Schizosaccharomyces japonicus (strain yFS275 / FY16936) TaxID=402676 RepID=B6K7W3_SCHJY|nr:TRAPP complex subunit Bet5 [Schizosaccharomyces japonicus yFS275]EEB09617.1 TRAPP complex subunit Bet5 [Schizosaccharomyces japonicus yFS275]